MDPAERLETNDVAPTPNNIRFVARLHFESGFVEGAEEPGSLLAGCCGRNQIEICGLVQRGTEFAQGIDILESNIGIQIEDAIKRVGQALKTGDRLADGIDFSLFRRATSRMRAFAAAISATTSLV